MTTPVPVTPLAIEDYDAIEAAVMETQRGRWFLTEYARRNRNCDTDSVLTGIERIERTLRRERAAPDIDRIRLDLADMAEAISRTKQEIAQMKLEAEHGGRFAEASQELDAIVEQTETATNEILLAAEGIQEVAWTLREAGAVEDLCEKLDAHATDVYTACSFQDLTGQRTRKVVTVLRYLESRINAMIDIWGMHAEDDAVPPAVDVPFDPMDVRPDSHLLNGPALQGRGVDQSQVDELMWADVAPIPTDVEDGAFSGETIEVEPITVDVE
ncbi:MAG: protein phosphatase CheZ, partial [Phyllobacteriaceae bacterium]|nr:protein phosphatase CheZ [Phyllobacteriaceae bacterium]